MSPKSQKKLIEEPHLLKNALKEIEAELKKLKAKKNEFGGKLKGVGSNLSKTQAGAAALKKELTELEVKEDKLKSQKEKFEDKLTALKEKISKMAQIEAEMSDLD